MSIAEPLPDNIRRIAVLVSSVDAATARQLLLHLPTNVGKQVRRALQNLGPISPSEKQRILAEFQQNAARQAQMSASQSAAFNPSSQAVSAASVPTQASISRASAQLTPASYNTNSSEQIAAPGNALHGGTAGAVGNATHAAGHESVVKSLGQEHVGPAWMRMDTRALGHFLRGERSSVIAVVINQLPPETGVALLQQLPSTLHREVLQAIANLQDIDSEALRAIEEHLSERLNEYELQVSSEAKGTRRIAALLAAAPPELQETWSKFVHLAVDSGPVAHSTVANQSQPSQVTPVEAQATVTKAPPQSRVVPEASIAAAQFTSHVVTTFDSQNALASSGNEDAHILPFPKPGEPRPMSDVDRSLLQLEFEQILSLSPHELAQILTAANSHTVLLALAGASPSFMKRFYAMLNKPDAKALASRLSQIGPLKLRDIDDAQRAIVELAERVSQPRRMNTQVPRTKRAAA